MGAYKIGWENIGKWWFFYDGFLAGFWLCTTWEKGVLYKQSIKLVHNFILSSSQYLLSFADSSLNLNIWLPGCSFQFHWIFSGRSHLPGNLMPRWCSATSHKSLNLKFPMKVESLPEKWGCFFLCRVCGVKCRWEHKLWRRQCMEIVACCIFVLFSKNAEMLLPGNMLPQKSFFFPQPQPSGQTCLLWSFVYPDVFPLESEPDVFLNVDVWQRLSGNSTKIYWMIYSCNWVSELFQLSFRTPTTEFQNSNLRFKCEFCVYTANSLHICLSYYHFSRFGRDQILQLLDWAGFRGRHEKPGFGMFSRLRLYLKWRHVRKRWHKEGQEKISLNPTNPWNVIPYSHQPN